MNVFLLRVETCVDGFFYSCDKVLALDGDILSTNDIFSVSL